MWLGYVRIGCFSNVPTDIGLLYAQQAEFFNEDWDSVCITLLQGAALPIED